MQHCFPSPLRLSSALPMKGCLSTHSPVLSPSLLSFGLLIKDLIPPSLLLLAGSQHPWEAVLAPAPEGTRCYRAQLRGEQGWMGKKKLMGKSRCLDGCFVHNSASWGEGPVLSAVAVVPILADSPRTFCGPCVEPPNLPASPVAKPNHRQPSLPPAGTWSLL